MRRPTRLAASIVLDTLSHCVCPTLRTRLFLIKASASFTRKHNARNVARCKARVRVRVQGRHIQHSLPLIRPLQHPASSSPHPHQRSGAPKVGQNGSTPRNPPQAVIPVIPSLALSIPILAPCGCTTTLLYSTLPTPLYACGLSVGAPMFDRAYDDEDDVRKDSAPRHIRAHTQPSPGP